MGIKDLDLRSNKHRANPTNTGASHNLNTKSADLTITDYFDDQLRMSGDFTLTALAMERGAAISAQEAFQFYRANAAVATSVDMIVDGLEQIKPMEKKNDDLVGEDTENIKELMHPNGIETYQEFIGKIGKHLLLTGNSYATLHGNIRRFPTAMFAPKPFFVQGIQSQDEYAESYMVTQGVSCGHYHRSGNMYTGDVRFLGGKKMSELIHLKRFSSRGSDILGDSPLTAAAIDTRQQISGRLHNLGMLENGARPSMLVNFSGLDASSGKPIVAGMDELRARAREVREQLAGKHNAGKIAVTTGYETKYHDLSVTNKDMDYSELDKISSEAIFRRYKIPLPLVMNQSATYNNVSNAIAFFYETTVLPLADTIFAWITRMLRMRGILDADTIISYSPETIPALMTKKLEEIKTRKEINVETINEIRESLPGRDQIEGGDVIYQPINMVPLGKAEEMMDNDAAGTTLPGDDVIEVPESARDN